MAKIKLHPTARAFLRNIGAEGGKSKSDAKRRASAANAAKAREARALKGAQAQ